MFVKKISIIYLMLVVAFQPCNAMLTAHVKQKELEQTVRDRMVQKVKTGKTVVSNAAQVSGHLAVGGFSALGWSAACGLGCSYACGKVANGMAISYGAKIATVIGYGCAGATVGCCIGVKLAQPCFKSAKEKFNQAMNR